MLIGRPEVAIVGFGLIGAGLSCIFPVALSAATRTPGMAAGTAIAGVCTIGYLGFLIGPPAIGGLAELFGLPAALGAVVLLFALIVVLGNRASERRETRCDISLSPARGRGAARHSRSPGAAHRRSAGPRRSPPGL